LEETELNVNELVSFSEREVLARMRERVREMSQTHPDSLSKL